MFFLSLQKYIGQNLMMVSNYFNFDIIVQNTHYFGRPIMTASGHDQLMHRAVMLSRESGQIYLDPPSQSCYWVWLTSSPLNAEKRVSFWIIFIFSNHKSHFYLSGFQARNYPTSFLDSQNKVAFFIQLFWAFELCCCCKNPYQLRPMALKV